MQTPSLSTSGSETVTGLYHDGHSAASQQVHLSIDVSGRLHVCGVEIDRLIDLETVELQPVLSNVPRLLTFADGSQCEVADHIAFDRLIAPRLRRPSGVEQWIYGVESRVIYVLLAVVLLGVVLVAAVNRGVPFIASVLATGVDPQMETALGERTLATLDDVLFQPSAVGTTRRRVLRERFDALRTAAGSGLNARLEFRTSSEIGPNAFTLPGGTVVLLDEMVSFAASDDEIAGVLSHELAHVQHRHIVRSTLQNAGVVLLFAAVFGDIVSSASFAATLPLAAVESSYSRDFEREADDFAVTLMTARAVSIDAYAALLERFERRERDAGERYPDFLASHPTNAERIEALRKRTR